MPPDDAIGVDDGEVLMVGATDDDVRAMSDDDGGNGTVGGGGGGGGVLSSYMPPFIIAHQLSPGPAVGVGHPAPVVTSCSPPPYSVPTAASPRSPMMIIVVVSDGVTRETAGHAVSVPGSGCKCNVSVGFGVGDDDGPIQGPATKHKNTSPDQFRVYDILLRVMRL